MVTKFTPSSIPGFSSPAVGFEQPFEMLHACHDRVRRSLALLEKLVAHLDSQGHDAASRSAAQDVLRYFDLAAPLHHEDEEVNIFPVLLAQADGGMHPHIHTLQEDHRKMAALWAQVRLSLVDWKAPASAGPVDAAARQAIAAFVALYASHLRTEEEIVYPAARGQMDSDQITQAGQQMQARRRAAP